TTPSPEVERIANMMCSADAEPAEREQARRVAHYELRLLKIREQRVEIHALVEASKNEGWVGKQSATKEAPSTTAMRSAAMRRLAGLDRYQRQALSGRKKAMLALCRLQTDRAWNS